MYTLITGATKGIGRALAFQLADDGRAILLTARTQKDLEDLRQDLIAQFPDCSVQVFPTDLGTKSGINAIQQFIHSNKLSIDVLINNAGLFEQGEFLNQGDTMERTMQLNFFGPYYLTQAVLPQMLERKQGQIINICSVASLKAFPNSSAYVSSKFALLGLTRSLRVDLKDKGIKVIAILPGATWSNSWEGVDLPKDRLMDPKEVALAVSGILKLGPTAVVEEIRLRPQLGDL